MQAPAFWWRPPGWEAALLRPAAALYGAVAARRLRERGTHAGVPVVCVGNPTLGGAGKTPTALAIAELLAAAGERPAFLSRGYGGRLTGPVQVDIAQHDAAAVGDEPILLARAFPAVVARDRVAGAALAARLGAGVVVMDDGFQNPSLAKDAALLVVDGARGLGNGRVFPAGPLRAPFSDQLSRCHVLVVVGAGDGAAPAVGAAATRGIPCFRARLIPDPEAVARLRGRPVLAFAGIGDPDKFFRTLADAGIPIETRRPFADHHRFTAADAAALLRDAEARGLAIVTTAKDFARLGGDPALAGLRERAAVLPVRLVFEDAEGVRALLAGRISARKGSGSGRGSAAT